MVETTLDIRFSADSQACVVVLDSNAAGDSGEQAELVCFGHYAARTVVLLGRERALPLVHSLTALKDASCEDLEAIAAGEGPELEGIHDGRVRVLDSDRSFRGDKTFRVLARFLNTRRGPRIFFAVRVRGLPAPEDEASSVQVLFYSLLKRRAADPQYVRRLATTAGLVGRLAGDGRITSDNQFDVSLAAADVAWRLESAALDVDDGEADLQCPTCGNRGSSAPMSEGFEFRLWPGDRAAIRKCRSCGTGLWLRVRRRPRPIAPEVWHAMEAMREELAGDAGAAPLTRDVMDAEDAAESALLGELRRVFVENRWPFSDVRGAEVLVSELSGPLGTWKFYAQVVEERDLVLLYSVCPLRAPEERRSEVAQFLTRANYGLAAGNFELDFEDGEIRYKTAFQVQGSELDGTTLKRLVRANGIAMETYLPGIDAVITGSPASSALERHPS